MRNFAESGPPLDGVTEAFDETDEMFSDERLLDVAGQLGDVTASATTQGLLDAVEAFAGKRGQSDDITVVALQVCGAARDAAADARAASQESEVA